ncbi:MAG TPA: hypothetical protein VE737_09645 [Actinomycetota bacterium]|nr:hypothetical protein [Actinomycetota bacterium]
MNRRPARWILYGTGYVGVLAAALFLPLRLLAPLRPAAGPVPGPTVTPEPPGPTAFVPPTYREGHSVVMPVTFPDGSTAELFYRPELDLASMGVRPYAAGCQRDFNLFYRHDPRGAEYGPEGPLTTYRGAGGSEVTLWKGRQGVDLYLRFQFEDWTVLMYDYANGLSDRQRAACAQALHGRQTNEGFLVLSIPDPPPTITSLAEAGQHLSRSELMFGDLDPGLLLFPGRCQPSPEDRAIDRTNGDPETFASWCDPIASMTVHVYDDQDPDFIRAVRRGLEFRNVHLAT